MKLNHETRFKIDLELFNEIDLLFDSFGQGLKKQDFCRAVFVLGIKEFNEQIKKGFYPSYQFVNLKKTIKFINK